MIDMKKKVTAPDISGGTDNGRSQHDLDESIISDSIGIFKPLETEFKSVFSSSDRSFFPAELIRQGRFCCWKYESRQGKPTKVPYHPITYERVKSNDIGLFVPYDDAIRAPGFDGIRIGIFNGVCAIDLDNCITENGSYTQMADEIVRLMHSYTEYSPSGKGLHILFKVTDFVFDSQQYYIMNHKVGVEVYVSGATNKYVTVTQNPSEPYDYEDRTEELKVLLQKYMRRPENNAVIAINAVNRISELHRSETSAVNAINAVKGSLGIAELVAKAQNSKNGAKFSALWAGDSSGYGSQSEADLALCCMLAFWTNCDAALMDAAFRQSGLMRPKWNRSQSKTTYGKITIQRAISQCTATYGSSSAIKGDTETYASEFPPIVPLTPQTSTLERFPLDALPSTIKNYVDAVAEHSQTEPDMAAVMALGTLAVCLQGKYKVEGTPGYYEPLSLYTVVIAAPGERKSSVLNNMTKYLYEYEQEYNRQRSPEIKENRYQRADLERQILVLKKKLEQKTDKKNEETLRALQEELDELPELKPVRFFADDCSSEALTSLLAANNGVFSVISSEGGIFDIMAGRYSNKANIDVWLKGHCGDPIHIDRSTRDAEVVLKPTLSAILSIQPSVLDEIMSNSTMTGRGLIARFLYALPPSKIGNRRFPAPGIPPEVEAAYREIIFRLMAPHGTDGEQILTLSKDGLDLISDYFQKHERFLTGEGQAIADWASKYIGTVLRIAGLLHVASTRNGNLEIPSAVIERAIKIGEYFKSQAAYAYSMMGPDIDIKKAEFVLSKIKQSKSDSIKRSDLFQRCRGKFFKKTEELFPVVDLLAEHGFIRLDSPPRQSSGRPADVRIIVNPAAVD